MDILHTRGPLPTPRRIPQIASIRQLLAFHVGCSSLLVIYWASRRLQSFGRKRTSRLSASRPASVICTFATSIILSPTGTFSSVTVARPWLTSLAIKLALKPWAVSKGRMAPLRPGGASMVRARRSSELRRGSSKRAIVRAMTVHGAPVPDWGVGRADFAGRAVGLV